MTLYTTICRRTYDALFEMLMTMLMKKIFFLFLILNGVVIPNIFVNINIQTQKTFSKKSKLMTGSNPETFSKNKSNPKNENNKYPVFVSKKLVHIYNNLLKFHQMGIVYHQIYDYIVYNESLTI